jgi:uncharacterized membrane protein
MPFPKVSLSDGLAVFGVILAIVLVILDKADKLKGPMLYVLLAVAAVLALPLALGNSWVSNASTGMLKFAHGALLVSLIFGVYSVFALWIAP